MRRSSSWELAMGLTGLVLGAAACSPVDTKPAPVPSLEAPAPVAPPLVYRLEPGDEIEIKVLEVEELNERVIVRPDGKVSVPLLDDVRAAGRTPEEIAQDLTRGYATAYANPTVTVIIRNFAQLNVYVGGEVDQPGIVPMENRMTATTAIFRAGGFLDTAQWRNVIVIRDAGGRPSLRAVDLRAVLKGEAPDVRLSPHDIVFVPKSTVAKLNLFFEQYVRRVIPFELSSAISYNYVSGTGR